MGDHYPPTLDVNMFTAKLFYIYHFVLFQQSSMALASLRIRAASPMSNIIKHITPFMTSVSQKGHENTEIFLREYATSKESDQPAQSGQGLCCSQNFYLSKYTQQADDNSHLDSGCSVERYIHTGN